MKKIGLIFLCLWAMLQTAAAQGVRFETGSFQEALAKAKQENKYLFVDVYTVWCGPCKHVAKNVFPQEKVGDYYNQHFVCYQIDAESEVGKVFTNKYPVDGYPTFFYLDGDGKVIHSFSGAKEVEGFMQEGRMVTMYAKYGGADKMQEAIDNGTAGIDLLYDYYRSATEEKQPEALNLYLMALPEEQLIDVENKYIDRITQYDYALLDRFIRAIVKASHDGRFENGNYDADFTFCVVFPIERFISKCIDRSIAIGDWEWFSELQQLKEGFADFEARHYPNGRLLDGDLNITPGRGIVFATPDYQKLCFWTANRTQEKQFSQLLLTYMDSLILNNPLDSVLNAVDYTTSREILVNAPSPDGLEYYINNYVYYHNVTTAEIIRWTDYFWRISPSDKKTKDLCQSWLRYAYDINPVNPYYVLSAADLMARLGFYKEVEKMLLNTRECLKEVKYNDLKILEKLDFKLQDVRNRKL